HLPEVSAHIGGDLPQPWLVVEGLREGCRLAEVIEHLPDLAKWPERIAQVYPKVDGLLLHGTALWAMREGCEGLVAARYDLSEGRTRQRPGTCLRIVRHRLVPHLAPQGMLG